MLFSKRLKDARQHSNYTQAELAEKVGVSKQAYRLYEQNKGYPREKVLDQICLILNVKKEYLLNTEILPIYQELSENNQHKVTEYATNLLTDEKNDNNIIEFKTWEYNFFEDAVSAGTGQCLVESRKETIKLPVNVEADFVVSVYGNSMEPEYLAGDYVFVKLTVDLKNNDVGIFDLCGDTYIKQLKINNSSGYLHSFNGTYEDIPIDQYSDFRIIGLVVGRYREK